MTTKKKNPFTGALKKAVKLAKANLDRAARTKRTLPEATAIARAQNKLRSVNKTFEKKPPAASNRTRENTLWEWLRDGVEGALRITKQLGLLHWHRIESGSTGKGKSDVEGIFDGNGFMLELKSTDRPPKGKINTGLTSEQAIFLRARLKAKGSAWALIRVAGGEAPESLYLVNARHATTLTKPIYESKLREISEWFEEPRDVLDIMTDHAKALRYDPPTVSDLRKEGYRFFKILDPFFRIQTSLNGKEWTDAPGYGFRKPLEGNTVQIPGPGSVTVTDHA